MHLTTTSSSTSLPVGLRSANSARQAIPKPVQTEHSVMLVTGNSGIHSFKSAMLLDTSLGKIEIISCSRNGNVFVFDFILGAYNINGINLPAGLASQTAQLLFTQNTQVCYFVSHAYRLAHQFLHAVAEIETNNRNIKRDQLTYYEETEIGAGYIPATYDVPSVASMKKLITLTKMN